MTETGQERELWILGAGGENGRDGIILDYLRGAGYPTRTATVEEIVTGRPLGIVLDISPHAPDGWGILISIKSDPATRDIPVLPVYLSEDGKIGGVFPVAGFFTTPIDSAYMAEKLAVLGLTDEAEDYDLQALVVSRKGDENISRVLTQLGFDVVNAYTGKEGVALATTGHQYMIFCALMQSDMAAFEFMERLRIYPQTRNIPLFVFVKDNMKDGERMAMSRQIEHLVRKKEISREEFLAHLRRRG
jgi:CheY-like chemotaxis protein